MANSGQEDSDSDGTGDNCDYDDDNDVVYDNEVGADVFGNTILECYKGEMWHL